MEIKQTQMIFLFPLFLSRFQKKQFYHVVAKVCRGQIEQSDITFYLCRTSDNLKYFVHSLGF